LAVSLAANFLGATEPVCHGVTIISSVETTEVQSQVALAASAGPVQRLHAGAIAEMPDP
jgi:hypothetical protein